MCALKAAPTSAVRDRASVSGDCRSGQKAHDAIGERRPRAGSSPRRLAGIRFGQAGAKNGWSRKPPRVAARLFPSLPRTVSSGQPQRFGRTSSSPEQCGRRAANSPSPSARPLLEQRDTGHRSIRVENVASRQVMRSSPGQPYPIGLKAAYRNERTGYGLPMPSRSARPRLRAHTAALSALGLYGRRRRPALRNAFRASGNAGGVSGAPLARA